MASPKSPVPHVWQIPQTILDRFGSDTGAQRTMHEEGHLVIVLHRPPVEGGFERKGELFWRNPQGQWRTTAQGTGLDGIRDLLDSYRKYLEKDAEAVRMANRAKDYFRVVKRLTPVARAIANGSEALQAARTAERSAREIIPLRDEAHMLARTASIILEQAKLGLDFELAEQAELQAKQSVKLAESGQRLNLFVALFLPLTTISAIFGMNTITEIDWVLFVLVLFLGALLGIGCRELLVDRPLRKEAAGTKEAKKTKRKGSGQANGESGKSGRSRSRRSRGKQASASEADEST